MHSNKTSDILPLNEAQRLDFLESLKLLDTEEDKQLDAITKLATLICEVPIGLISLVDKHRQWFKSRVGLDVKETEREIAFCQYTILNNEYFEVADSFEDDRFKDNPLVTGAPNIRFYGAFPLVINDFCLGSLCMISDKPKTLNSTQKEALKILTQQVVNYILLQTNQKDIINLKEQQILQQEEIIKINQKYNDFFDNALGLQVVLNPDGKILAVNNEFSTSFDLEKNEAIGSLINNYFKCEKKLSLENFMQEISEQKKISTILLSKPASKPFLTNNIYIENQSNPSESYILMNCSDISEQKANEKKLQELLEENKKISKLKETFLANVSHEIRTPLNAIIGFSNILKNTSLNNTQAKFTDAINKASNDLLLIVNDILDFSKIEAKQMGIELEVFNLNEIFTQLKNMFLTLANEKGIKLRFYIESDIPHWVLGDPLKFKQILINLVGNSIKFTSKGKVEIFCAIKNRAENNIHLEIQIVDTGIGISKDKQELIFERFAQADQKTAREFGGTGLGLNITRELTLLLGGDLRLESTKGKGSNFTITLPFKIAKEPTESLLEKTIEKEEGRLIFNKILLVEDNKFNQMLAMNYLSKIAKTVDLAENGKLALDVLKNNSYDIILMDIQMPVMDGYECTKIIREELGLKTPIIAITAHSLRGEKEKCLALGMNDFITKPYNPEILEEVMRKNMQLDVDSSTFNSASELYNCHKIREYAGWDDQVCFTIVQKFMEKTPVVLEQALSAYHNKNGTQVSNFISGLQSSFDIIGSEKATTLCTKITHNPTHTNTEKSINELILLTKQTIFALKERFGIESENL